MSGVQVRLGQLFNPESGRSFITAFDHGTSLPMPGSGKPMELLKKIIDGGPEGVLVGPGILKQGAELFAPRNAPAPVLRADWTFLDESAKQELGERYRVLTSPSEALALGAQAIVMYLIGRPTDGAMFADNVAAVANAAHEARVAGIPLIVEATLWGLRNEDRKDPAHLANMCRIAAELGADAIKTEYTGDPATMTEIIDLVGDIPVFTLGGARGSQDAVAQAAQGAIRSGAKGLIFGRNVWQADDVVATTKQLLAITHGDVSGDAR